MKILKWILIGLGIVIVILVVAVIFFRIRYNKMVDVIDRVELTVIDLEQIEEAILEGEIPNEREAAQAYLLKIKDAVLKSDL